MQLRVTKDLWFYAVCNVLLFIVLSAWLYLQNQPAVLTSPIHLAQNKVQCVSYAPYYRHGDSPMVEGIWVTPAQIDKDLQLLSTMSHCIRTYSVGQGMDYVPEAAKKLGMTVYLGAWVGWADADNVKEIKLATQVANAYPTTVKSLVIGNEVFLRGEQSEDAMKRYFSLARSQSKTPITYAEVWEFWIKHKEMAQYVDFQTVHILPYWENNPVAIEGAVQHAEKVMDKMASIFTKPILIGETGWPSAGRQRNESEPSGVNQARYIRGFLQKADEKQWQYNIIEAIDQPWKRTLEGTVGGYWGIVDADLKPKFSLTGPVAERNDQYRLVAVGLMGALVFLGLALMLNEQRANALIGMSALGALAGLMLVLKHEYLIAACRDWIEWLALGSLGVLGTLLVCMQPWMLAKRSASAIKTMAVLRLFFLYGALVAGYLIYVDGRYRDFPVMLFLLPTIAMVGDWTSRPRATVANWLSYALPGALGVMFAVLCVGKELTNNAALLWFVLIVLLAYSNWPNQQKHQL